ncbi:hypothetical protein GCM10018987_54060 [Streptomyces cremeus]
MVTGPSKVVKPGGGSARRTHARYTCVGTTLTAWRSRVDVDIEWVIDSAEKLVTAPQNLRCGAR